MPPIGRSMRFAHIRSRNSSAPGPSTSSFEKLDWSKSAADSRAARPFRGLGIGLRPAMMLATVALLLAAVVAIGVGGPKRSVVLPNASPSASPSLGPNPSPTGTASGGIVVDLSVAAGEPQTVDVIDASGKLLEATSGSPTSAPARPTSPVRAAYESRTEPKRNAAT